MSRAAKSVKADINAIERARELRKCRESRPYLAFHHRFMMHLDAEEELKASAVSAETKWLLQSSFVTGVVTATEVYFRDMLDVIFRTCNPQRYLGKLRDLHDEKYRIDDLISIYVKNVHPCELILNGLSFQRLETVDRVFTKVIDEPFLRSVVPVQVRVKDDPSTETTINKDVVGKYERLLELRHELTHDPDVRKRSLSAEEESWIAATMLFIFACDIRLTRFIGSNLDADLARVAPAQ